MEVEINKEEIEKIVYADYEGKFPFNPDNMDGFDEIMGDRVISITRIVLGPYVEAVFDSNDLERHNIYDLHVHYTDPRIKREKYEDELVQRKVLILESKYGYAEPKQDDEGNVVLRDDDTIVYVPKPNYVNWTQQLIDEFLPLREYFQDKDKETKVSE